MPTVLPIANDKQSPTEANDDYIVKEKCNKCKRFPCLDEESVTSENFVHKGYFRGPGTKGPIHGYTYIGSLGKYQGEKYTGKWLLWSYIQNKGEVFTQTFNENMKSLKYSCHIK